MTNDPLNQLSHEYLPAIEEALVRGIAQTNHTGLDQLHHMLAYHMGWDGDSAGSEARGKRIRPLLVLLSCASAGGDWKIALPAASAVELVHNFSLIHDDIEDNSPLRHGRPTLWKLWGIPQAINAGDAMFAIAHLEILRLANSLSCDSAIQAATLLQMTCLHLTQGQYLDLSYEGRMDITPDDYWTMIGGKTSALLAACTRLGALAANVNANRQHQYSEFGRYLGLAFQIQDDILGIWGNTEQTGKSAASDLVTGKKSLPVIYGLNQKGAFAKRWSCGAISPNEVSHLAELLDIEGSRAYCSQMAKQYTTQALQSLNEAQPQGLAGEALRQLADKLLKRRV